VAVVDVIRHVRNIYIYSPILSTVLYSCGIFFPSDYRCGLYLLSRKGLRRLRIAGRRLFYRRSFSGRQANGSQMECRMHQRHLYLLSNGVICIQRCRPDRGECDGNRSSWSQRGQEDGGLLEDAEAERDDSVSLTAETREAVSAVKFVAAHLKQEDDFAEVCCFRPFLPRDAMRNRGLCCRPVFVRLSVRHVREYCIQTAKDVVKLLSRPGNPIILVSDPTRRYPITRRTTSVGRKIHGAGENLRFSTEIAVCLGNGTR